MLRALFIPTAIILSGFLLKSGLEKFKSSERLVEVRGLSEQIVISNEASWTITYAALGNDLLATNEVYLKNQKVLFDFFKKLGFDESEIQKSPASIVDNWANAYGSSRPPNKITIRGSVGIATTKVDLVSKAQEKTDELIKLGVAFEGSATHYYFTDLNKVKASMIKEANQNAKAAAQNFADDTDSELGKIKSAAQGLFTISDSGDEYSTNQSINKKVRVVNQVSYYLN